MLPAVLTISLLGDYHETSNGELLFSKSNFVVRDDIRNVAISLGLTLYERHTNDAISVDLLVKEASEREDNPFFCYNPQTGSNSVFTLGKLLASLFLFYIQFITAS